MTTTNNGRAMFRETNPAGLTRDARFVSVRKTGEDKDKEKARTYEVAISSEEPVERYFGIEILSHDKDAVDLSRLSDGRHPLLVNHSTDDQIGVVESARLDDDKILRGDVRFSRSARAQEIEQDVGDEIRTLISVGYEIISVQEKKTRDDGTVETRDLTGEELAIEMRSKYGSDWNRAAPQTRADSSDKLPVYVVNRWRPFEVSVVPIPADVRVGVGRAAGVGAGNHDDNDDNTAERTGDDLGENQETPKPAETIKQISQKGERKMETPSGKEAEEKRRNEILEIGERYAKYIKTTDISEALRADWSPDKFRDLVMDRMETQHTKRDAGEIGMTQKEVRQYSFGRAIVAAMTGDWSKAGFELEASRAVEKQFGMTAQGFLLPIDYLNRGRRDFNMGTATEAGNLRETMLDVAGYTDVYRANMVLGGMGIRILSGLSGNVDIPKKAVASTLGMLAERGSASETNPTTGKATLSPKRVGAYVEPSKQSIIQSAIALEPMLRDDLVTGAAVLMESQAINGVGSNNEMTGIRTTSGIGTVVGGTNGLALAWSHLVDLESACANVNAEPGLRAGYVTNTKVRGKGKQVTKSTYMPFLWVDGATPFNGYRVGVTNNVPSNLTKGTSTTICSSILFASDWSMGVLGLFGAPDVTVDPYTLADTGGVRITLNQYADFVVRRAEAFAKMDDALTT